MGDPLPFPLPGAMGENNLLVSVLIALTMSGNYNSVRITLDIQVE